MCCWPCSRREPRWRACSPNPRPRPRPSNGAASQAQGGTARALVVNSGNANAFTGKAGLEGARAGRRSRPPPWSAARRQEVFLASTGVIGEPLPAEKITRILGTLAEDGAAGGWRAAAEAIMTTDTFPKLATATAMIDGHKVTINGIAKGSGMIAPDMATMLAFVFTDANLPASVLQELLTDGVAQSFNCHHGGQRHLHQRHAAAVRHRQGRARIPPITKASDKRLTEFRRNAGRGAARPGAAGGARTAKARRN